MNPTRTEVSEHSEPLCSNPVLDWQGRPMGELQSTATSPDGEMMLIKREEWLGGGTIVIAARDASWVDGAWHLPYGERSLREAPPYSPNVDLHAYFEFWKRLAGQNFNQSMAGYMSVGSGPVSSDVNVSDDQLHDEVIAALGVTSGIYPHLIEVSVKRGTVLLEGWQNDTSGRLKAAQTVALVPGVKEIVNMLVLRALV